MWDLDKKYIVFIETNMSSKKLNYMQLVKMSKHFSTTEILSTVQISGKSQTFSLFYDEICHHEISSSFLKSIFTFKRVLMTITAFRSL